MQYQYVIGSTIMINALREREGQVKLIFALLSRLEAEALHNVPPKCAFAYNTVIIFTVNRLE